MKKERCTEGPEDILTERDRGGSPAAVAVAAGKARGCVESGSRQLLISCRMAASWLSPRNKNREGSTQADSYLATEGPEESFGAALAGVDISWLMAAASVGPGAAGLAGASGTGAAFWYPASESFGAALAGVDISWLMAAASVGPGVAGLAGAGGTGAADVAGAGGTASFGAALAGVDIS